MKRFVAYHRVSTKGQGESGLGLEAQEKAVADHVEREGGTVLRAYREVESGKNDDRPELARAVLHAKRSGATLLVAKLDRLSRNVRFLAELMESKAKFCCCDMPDATDLTIHIYAAMAQWERERISERTREGLAAAKAKGKLLGSARPDHWTPERHARRLAGLRDGRAKGLAVRQANAEKMHRELCPVVIAYRTEGMTLAAIAARLNDEGWLTPRRRQWNEVYVHRFLKQCEQTGRERTSARV